MTSGGSMITQADLTALMQDTKNRIHSASIQYYIDYVNMCLKNKTVVLGPVFWIADKPDVIAAQNTARGVGLYWDNYTPFNFSPASAQDNIYYGSGTDQDGYPMYIPSPANASEADKLHMAGPINQAHSWKGGDKSNGWKGVLNARQNIPQQRVELKNHDRQTN